MNIDEFTAMFRRIEDDYIKSNGKENSYQNGMSKGLRAHLNSEITNKKNSEAQASNIILAVNHVVDAVERARH
jgi:hypothetical protein